MKKKLLFVLLFLLSLTACENDDNDEKSCEGVSCTKNLMHVTVELKDQSGEPIALDDFKVIRFKDEKNITMEFTDYEWRLYQKYGSYPLISDLNLEEYRNKEVKVQFTGFLSSKEVVNEVYLVGADCCHVMLIEGDNMITINRE